eukprot:gene1934-2112_t
MMTWGKGRKIVIGKKASSLSPSSVEAVEAEGDESPSEPLAPPEPASSSSQLPTVDVYLTGALALNRLQWSEVSTACQVAYIEHLLYSHSLLPLPLRELRGQQDDLRSLAGSAMRERRLQTFLSSLNDLFDQVAVINRHYAVSKMCVTVGCSLRLAKASFALHLPACSSFLLPADDHPGDSVAARSLDRWKRMLILRAMERQEVVALPPAGSLFVFFQVDAPCAPAATDADLHTFYLDSDFSLPCHGQHRPRRKAKGENLFVHAVHAAGSATAGTHFDDVTNEERMADKSEKSVWLLPLRGLRYSRYNSISHT